MKKFDYTKTYMPGTSELRMLGSDGWELVGFDKEGYYVFKKEISSNEENIINT